MAWAKSLKLVELDYFWLKRICYPKVERWVRDSTPWSIWYNVFDTLCHKVRANGVFTSHKNVFSEPWISDTAITLILSS